MAPSICHLPNGQNIMVTPVFGGLSFKPVELNNHRSAFPPGWTVVLNEEEGDDEDEIDSDLDPTLSPRKHTIHRYKRPTCHNDHLFISSISSPNTAEFRPATSPTRQLAMMLWTTLWWYFHQPEPDRKVHNALTELVPDAGRPKGEWRININREGIFKGKNILAKFERMGLITTEDSSVGLDYNEKAALGFRKMFVTRRAFWLIDPRIYLFTLTPVMGSPYPSASPFGSRTSSPRRDGGRESPGRGEGPGTLNMSPTPAGAITPIAGPYQSTSHLPTYYPPHPVQYVFTNNIRHPLRPKPARQGETVYMRYIPSLGQYLSFRIASLSPTAPSQLGPWSVQNSMQSAVVGIRNSLPHHNSSDTIVPTLNHLDLGPNDIEILHGWMNDPRIIASGLCEPGDMLHVEDFLKRSLSSKHSFPVIGCWDGKPFGFFEIYWVKEDTLGKYIGGECGNWDRGIHCMVGQEEFRGPHRVRVWLSALVHYCWLTDMRTDCVMMEPRVDNTKIVEYGYELGFNKEREIAFPFKQANLMKVNREAWEKPVI